MAAAKFSPDSVSRIVLHGWIQIASQLRAGKTHACPNERLRLELNLDRPIRTHRHLSLLNAAAGSLLRGGKVTKSAISKIGSLGTAENPSLLAGELQLFPRFAPRK